ncbi:MAG: hypothetical protein ACSLEZ_15045 [Thiobacillus sp.]
MPTCCIRAARVAAGGVNDTLPRRRNPGPVSHSARVDEALAFYQQFHWGEPAKKLSRRKLSSSPKVAVKLGTLHAVTYETVKNGERALWEHEFGEEGGRKPDLVMDAKNKRLHIVGGDYDVRPEGIVD